MQRGLSAFVEPTRRCVVTISCTGVRSELKGQPRRLSGIALDVKFSRQRRDCHSVSLPAKKNVATQVLARLFIAIKNNHQ